MTLSQVRNKLEQRVGPQESIPFWAVNTRLFLRTGVDLKNIKPDQETKPDLIGKVLQVLGELGHAL